ncbi:nitroreductase family deazaflavin-dependent oxidoreductase [Mycobacterium sp. NPDC003449]
MNDEADQDKLLSDTKAINDFNATVIDEFRANGGTLSETFAKGIIEVRTLLLLHTTGAKSGHPRLTPLSYVSVDGRMFIVGSFGGAPIDPAWVHNLRTDSSARIEVGPEVYDVTARELGAEERDATWSEIVRIAPLYAEYETKTDRTIPLFELVRA